MVNAAAGAMMVRGVRFPLDAMSAVPLGFVYYYRVDQMLSQMKCRCQMQLVIRSVERAESRLLRKKMAKLVICQVPIGANHGSIIR